MKINVSVKPIIKVNNSKDELLTSIRKMGNFGYTLSYGFISANDGTHVAYNIHKVNTKHKVLKNGKRKLVRRAHWIAYVYTFDNNLLNAAGLVIQQNLRNFKLISKKA